MKSTPHANATAATIVAGAAICAGAAATVVASTAAVVALTGLADDTRRLLRFDFGGVDHSPAEAIRIALHNVRFAAGTLLCTAARPHIPAPARAIVDVLLAALLMLNAGAVGVALGAYGARVAAATATHLPLEFAALSLAGGAYMSTSKRPLSTSVLARIAAVTVVLLAAAAAIETYASLGGLR